MRWRGRVPIIVYNLQQLFSATSKQTNTHIYDDDDIAPCTTHANHNYFLISSDCSEYEFQFEKFDPSVPAFWIV